MRDILDVAPSNRMDAVFARGYADGHPRKSQPEQSVHINPNMIPKATPAEAFKAIGVFFACAVVVLIFSAMMPSVYPPGAGSRPLVLMFIVVPATGALASALFELAYLEDTGTRMWMNSASRLEGSIAVGALVAAGVFIACLCYAMPSIVASFRSPEQSDESPPRDDR
jgi:hypothetical protein